MSFLALPMRWYSLFLKGSAVCMKTVTYLKQFHRLCFVYYRYSWVYYLQYLFVLCSTIKWTAFLPIWAQLTSCKRRGTKDKKDLKSQEIRSNVLLGKMWKKCLEEILIYGGYFQLRSQDGSSLNVNLTEHNIVSLIDNLSWICYSLLS